MNKYRKIPKISPWAYTAILRKVVGEKCARDNPER